MDNKKPMDSELAFESKSRAGQLTRAIDDCVRESMTGNLEKSVEKASKLSREREVLLKPKRIVRHFHKLAS